MRSLPTVTAVHGTAAAEAKPPLKWAGGKRWQVSVSFRDLELDPDDFVYADPPYDVEFNPCGGG